MAIAPDTTETSQTLEYLDSKMDSKRNATLIQLGCVAAAALCMVFAGLLQNPINQQRKDLQLVLNSNVYKELPPEYAWVTAALGPFRGIFADIMWARSEQLKQDGKYFELHQLAKWICTLQPRFGQVWSFQAWNMSYNISVATHTAAERWQWVYNGIRLLRDEGIPNNERNLLLYQQLAWIWFHKVGDRMDDFHMAYKRAWATTMEVLLGAPPMGASSKEQIDWFRPVAQASRSLTELEAAHPGVKDLIGQLKTLGVDVNVGTKSQNIFHPLEEHFFKPYTKYLQNKFFAEYRLKKEEVSKEQEKLFAFFEAAPKADLDPLLAWLRAKVLREQYKMDPQYMLDLTGRLGTKEPLAIDWRTPWSQTIYWASLGSDRGSTLKKEKDKEFEMLQVDRNLLFAIKTMAKQGRYIFRANVEKPLESFLNVLPDLRWVEAMHKKYIELGPRYKDEGENVEGVTSETLRSGHVNELEEAIANLYLSGRTQEARDYLDYLAKNYPNQYTKEKQEQYVQDLQTFVFGQIRGGADSYNTANAMIFSCLQRAYTFLAAGAADEYAGAVHSASVIYQKFQEDKEKEPQGRRALPSFVQMQADGLADFVLTSSWPLSIRSGVWSRITNPEIKQPIYDFVLPELAAQCQAVGFDVNKAFPAPAGMEAWRAAHPNMEGSGLFIPGKKPAPPKK
jgi:hypothetical protein